jgi:hypothetical protein
VKGRMLVASPVAIVASLVLAASANAAGETAQVTTASDTGPFSPPTCSLRDAIAAVTANGTVGGCTVTDTNGLDDHVTFAPALIGGQTITLNGSFITINDAEDLDISGPGMNGLTVSGNDLSRIFDVQSRTAISGLSLVHGGGGEVTGGAIESTANVTFGLVLTDVKVANSGVDAASPGPGATVFADGGGIHSTGPLVLNQSVVTGNHATANNDNTTSSDGAEARGGGIFAQDDLIIADSTISDNQATATTAGAGGTQAAATAGIRSDGALDLSGSTISGNAASAIATGMATAHARGGLFQNGIGGIQQSTIAGNTSSLTSTVAGASTGGLDIGNDTNINSSTIAGNGPASLLDNFPGGNVEFEGGVNEIENSIIANPRGGAENCAGSSFTSTGFNDDFSPAGASCFNAPQTTDLTSNPLLAAGGLANNGGPTKTIALQPTSPMIDQGSNANLTDPNQDQRGASFPRPIDFSLLPNANNGTDIGAFEVQQACPPFVQSTPTTPCPPSGGGGGGGGGGSTPLTSTVPGPTGLRAAALKRCKKKHGLKRKKCVKRAKQLPV